MMFGLGSLKGLFVTLKNLVLSYFTKERLTTVQYPEERVRLKERFRNFPFLVYDGTPDKIRCTACGMCGRECPPQCITVIMDKDETGKPARKPATFEIDYSVCMNCGICEDVCPFNAIFIGHEYELSEYQRGRELIYDKQKLLKPADYLAKIRPTAATRGQAPQKESV